MICAFCHKVISEPMIHIRDECPACGGDLHICLNCEFYDQSAYSQCRETIKEPVQDKEKANYCDFFRAAKAVSVQADTESDTFKKLSDLFE
ncbi:hypothetical protein ACFLZ5_08750 [Thermodesulfobacteriota bacterium]